MASRRLREMDTRISCCATAPVIFQAGSAVSRGIISPVGMSLRLSSTATRGVVAELRA